MPPVCSGCGKVHGTSVHSRDVVVVEDLRISGKRVLGKALKEWTWIITAIKSKIPAFVELGYKFFRKRHYVLNYFLCKITTAISEGINNKIKRLTRMAYGYRNVHYFLLKIHQHCGLLNPRLSP